MVLRKAIVMPEASIRKTCSFDVCWMCESSCCQDAKPPLTNKRIQIIKEYLKNHGGHAEQVFARFDYSFPSVDSDEICVFYDKATKKCQIHEVKPETCRAGPVTFDINRHTKKVEWFLKTRELCLFAGKLFDTPAKLNEHLEATKPEIMRLICELEAEDLLAILKRDEPQTFKIGEEPLPHKVLVKLGLE
jgi:Fe-S-cluster containining protein